MGKSKNKKLTYCLPAIIWMTVIFLLSSIKGSGDNTYNLFYFIERKSFHVIEYFILASLIYYAWARSFSIKKPLLSASVVALLYAISDEWHQTFVFGREGRLRDVVIDLAGIIIAGMFILKFRKWKKGKKQSN